MARTVKSARVEIEVGANLDGLDQDFNKAEQRAIEHGKKIANAAAKGLQSTPAGGADGGAKLASRWLRGLETEFDRGSKKAKEALARGIIDEKEFGRRGQVAAAAFNQKLLDGLDKLRAAGKISERIERELVGELKDTGLKAGRALGDGIEQGTKAGGSGALNWMKGVFILQLSQMLTMISSRITTWSRDFFNLALEIGETTSLFETTFGSATEGVNRFIEARARLSGQSHNEAREFLSLTGAIAQQMGFATKESAEFSQSVFRLAQDLTSAKNVPFEQSLRAINSALVGEREALKTLGIVVKQEDVEEQALLETRKKNVKELTKLDEATAALTLITRNAGVAVGDLDRTKESASNRARALTGDIKQLRDEIALELLPVFGELITEGASWFEANREQVKQAISDVAQLIITFGRLAGALSKPFIFTLITVPEAIGKWERGLNAWLYENVTERAGGGPRVATGDALGDHRKGFTAAESREARTRAKQRGGVQDMRSDNEREREITNLEQAEARTHAAQMKREEDARKAREAREKANKKGTDSAKSAIDSLTRDIQEHGRAKAAAASIGYASLDDVPADLVANLRQLITLENQLAEIRKNAAIAGKRAPAGTAARIAEMEAEAKAIRTVLQEQKKAREWWNATNADGTPDRAAAHAALAPTIATVKPPSIYIRPDTATPQVEKLTREYDAIMEELQLRLEKGLMNREDFELAGLLAAQDFHTGLLQMLERLTRQGILTPAAKKAIAGALGGLNLDPMKAGIMEISTEVGKLAKGLLSVGDAMGGWGEEAERVLGSIIGAVDAVQGVVKGMSALKSAQTSMEKIAASGDIFVAALRLGMEVGKGLLAIFGVNKALESSQHSALVDNTRALRSLERSLLTNVSSNQAKADIGSAQSDAAFLEGNRHTYSDRGSDKYRKQALHELAVSKGMTGWEDLIAYYEEMDKRYGTNLAQFVKNADPEGLMKALQALPEAIQTELGEFGTFGDDVAGILAKISWEMKVLGKTDAAERLKAMVAALKAAGKSAGDFQDELEEMAGLDLNTEDGRKRRDEILASLVAQMAAGGASLGDFSVEQMRQFLEEWQAAGDKSADGGSTNSFQVNRSITEVTGTRLVGYLATGVFWQERAARAAEAIAAIITGGAFSPIAVPSSSPTPAGAAAITDQAAGTTTSTTTVTIGEIVVAAPEAGTDPYAYGQQVGAGFREELEHVDQGLHIRATDHRRRAGAAQGA